MHDHDYDVDSPAAPHVQTRSDREEDGFEEKLFQDIDTSGT